MSGAGRLLFPLLVAGSAAWGGLAAGERGVTVAGLRNAVVSQVAVVTGRETAAIPSPGTSGPVIYWRHPDGLPQWSATEWQTPDGRAFLPVRTSEDISLDPAPAPAVGESGERRIAYYRNPMGLPDTSPVPRKDSMGMDYIPVYEGGDSDDGSVMVSPGKLQRTGVRTAKAVLAPLATTLRAPGIVMLDERRVSVISLRADAFIETVADVTTGSMIDAGAHLITLYSAEIASAIALYVSDLRVGGGRARRGAPAAGEPRRSWRGDRPDRRRRQRSGSNPDHSSARRRGVGTDGGRGHDGRGRQTPLPHRRHKDRVGDC